MSRPLLIATNLLRHQLHHLPLRGKWLAKSELLGQNGEGRRRPTLEQLQTIKPWNYLCLSLNANKVPLKNLANIHLRAEILLKNKKKPRGKPRCVRYSSVLDGDCYRFWRYALGNMPDFWRRWFTISSVRPQSLCNLIYYYWYVEHVTCCSSVSACEFHSH